MGMKVDGHAFLSYVREDADRVDELQRTLEAAGVRVWRDTEDLWPGEDWRVKIRQAITDDALLFVACFSENSLSREKSFQNEELNLAVEQLRLRRPDVPWLIPVRFDDCKVPSYDIGGGRTLDSIQRVDLFGGSIAAAVAKLVAAALRILSGSAALATASPPSFPSQPRVKDLLPHPEKDIALEELVLGAAEKCARILLDDSEFPVSSSPDFESDDTRYLINRTRQYDAVIQPLIEMLKEGCAWGVGRHDAIWRRAVEAIGRTAGGLQSGHTVLIELKNYPLLPVVYSAGIAAIYRENWQALRAVTTEATVRDHERRRLPLIARLHVWAPFGNAKLAANVLAYETTKGAPLTADEVRSLRAGRTGMRFTPVSDHLHDRLRPTFTTLITDDVDYDEVFDELEVVLGIIATDVAAQARLHEDRWLPGASIGAFTWRHRYDRTPFHESVWQRRSTALLSGGFFDADQARAQNAFEEFSEKVDHVGRGRF